ncbi:hypothetical protein BDV96DRAFT_645268 [Lophiotrema nucula]|uniref:Glycine zipper 2TM domain-containing protein n=1 Tax=Lophiotrema nucula TaxID=690887 RepID=A0A6A5ZD46_9PLEO|nr:hypothetical protein BDV96DRAFT_645268 [Lophiotrema nucula]
MSVLAFKALSMGAEKIPDKFFHKIPGGFFTPEEVAQQEKSRKERKDRKDRKARSSRSEHRDSDRTRRRSHRDRTPPTDYSDYSGRDDTDFEKEYRDKQRRRRTKSLGRRSSRSRSFTRGRDRQGSLDGEVDMDRAERGRREYTPPPNSEYRPYNPADYAPGAAAATGAYYDDRRTSSAQPDYGYPPQVNTAFRSRSASVASAPPLLPPAAAPNLPWWMMRASTSSPLAPRPPTAHALSYAGSPLQRVFSPSYEPPLALLLQHSGTNSPQPANSQRAGSSFASRYTPSQGYAPSPVNAHSPIPPPPAAGYTPYHPSDYASPHQPYNAPGNAHPSAPPFYRQQSRSQPSLADSGYPYSNNNQLTYYDPPPEQSRRHHHDDGKSHRARSADHRRRSRSRVTDQFRDRFDNMDDKQKDLAASAGGALVGGFVGNQFGHGTLSTIIGAAVGGLGARELERRHEK